MRVKVISGAIGAGKSSIMFGVEAMAAQQSDTHVHVLQEDTREWQFYLERYYRSPREYAFLFQKEVEMHFHRVTKRLEKIAESDADAVVYVERSPLDVLRVFLPLNYDNLSRSEYECLKTSMELYAERQVWKRAQYLMISCPPNLCLDRVAKRNRAGEESLDLAHMKRVDELYATFPAERIENSGNLLDAVERVLSL